MYLLDLVVFSLQVFHFSTINAAYVHSELMPELSWLGSTSCTSAGSDQFCDLVCPYGFNENLVDSTPNNDGAFIRGVCQESGRCYCTVGRCQTIACNSREVSCSSTQGCICKAGWEGVLCEKSKAEAICHPNPCVNGQCIAMIDGRYDCICNEGFQRGVNPVTCTSEDPINKIFAFGDSNPDNGVQIGKDDHGFKRSSNGVTWPTYLENEFKLAMENWAYSGALSGQGNYYNYEWSGVLWQIQQCDQLSRNSLVVVQASVNDFFTGADAESDVSETVLENSRLTLDLLVEKGVEYIVFINVEDITLMPGFDEFYLSQKDVIKQRIAQTNSGLLEMVNEFRTEHPSVTVVYVDLHGEWEELTNGFAHPTGFKSYATEGFSETEQFDYVWYDKWHLTTQFHLRIAQKVVEAIIENVSEPMPPAPPMGY